MIVIHPPPHDPTVPTPAADTLRSSSDPATFEVRVFTLATDVLAVDGATAVVLAEVRYGDPLRQEYRDLWVIRLRDDGYAVQLVRGVALLGSDGPSPPATISERPSAHQRPGTCLGDVIVPR